MKFLLIIFSFTTLAFLPSCRFAHGDGPDVATPAHHKKKDSESQKNPRKSNWLTENLHRERVSKKDINTPGGNEDFKVFPVRDKYRSENTRRMNSPFFWK